MGHYFADKKYRTSAGCQSEQTGSNGFGIAFTPLMELITFISWKKKILTLIYPVIRLNGYPRGYFMTCFDTRNETGNPVIDGVSGYTNHQMFNAFQSSIYTLGDYRFKLIQQNPNNPTISQVTNLFAEYHY